MGTVTPGAPRRLLETLRRQGGYRVFVETGTARGDTAAMAGNLFETVITMEADQGLSEAARERLSGRQGILPLCGDSRDLLPQWMPRLAGPAVFWLDAHFCGGASFGRGDECPVLAEIAAVVASPLAHVVLIDDARLFAAPPPPPHDPADWPTLDAVLAALDGGAPRDAVLIDDVIIALPRSRADLWDALFPAGRPAFLVPAHA